MDQSQLHQFDIGGLRFGDAEILNLARHNGDTQACGAAHDGRLVSAPNWDRRPTVAGTFTPPKKHPPHGSQLGRFAMPAFTARAVV